MMLAKSNHGVVIDPVLTSSEREETNQQTMQS